MIAPPFEPQYAADSSDASATHVGAAVLVGLAVVGAGVVGRSDGAGVVAGDDAPATVGRHVVNVGACVGDCASAA